MKQKVLKIFCIIVTIRNSLNESRSGRPPFLAASSAASLPTSAITPGMMGAPDPGRIIPASHPGTTDTTGDFHTGLCPPAPQETPSTAGPGGHARMKSNRAR